MFGNWETILHSTYIERTAVGFNSWGFGLKIETALNVAARSLGGCAYLGGLEIAKNPSREERLAVRRVQYSMHPSTTLYHEIVVEGFGFDGC